MCLFSLIKKKVKILQKQTQHNSSKKLSSFEIVKGIDLTFKLEIYIIASSNTLDLY